MFLLVRVVIWPVWQKIVSTPYPRPGNISQKAIGFAPGELEIPQNWDGWVTVIDEELSPDEWTKEFDSTRFFKWRVWHCDIQAEIKGLGIKEVRFGYNYGPNKKIRWRGNGHLKVMVLPW